MVRVWRCITGNEEGAGLMGGQDGDFGYLHMLGCGGHIEAYIGNVVVYQRLHSFLPVSMTS